MKCLSIRQPWAGLIFADRPGWKNIENRQWYTRQRGWVLIHAAKTPASRAEFDAAREMARAARLQIPVDGLELKYGGVIGMVKIVDCVKHSKSPWFAGPYGFVLEDPYPLPWEPSAGQTGLYDYGTFKMYDHPKYQPA